MKAMASSRNTSTPLFASHPIRSTNSQKTSGLAQLRSHCQVLKVVRTQPPTSSSQEKLPGAKSGKISGRLSSQRSTSARSVRMWK